MPPRLLGFLPEDSSLEFHDLKKARGPRKTTTAKWQTPKQQTKPPLVPLIPSKERVGPLIEKPRSRSNQLGPPPPGKGPRVQAVQWPPPKANQGAPLSRPPSAQSSPPTKWEYNPENPAPKPAVLPLPHKNRKPPEISAEKGGYPENEPWACRPKTPPSLRRFLDPLGQATPLKISCKEKPRLILWEGKRVWWLAPFATESRRNLESSQGGFYLGFPPTFVLMGPKEYGSPHHPAYWGFKTMPPKMVVVVPPPEKQGTITQKGGALRHTRKVPKDPKSQMSPNLCAQGASKPWLFTPGQ
ncbi:basic salivary proline-rich protein 1-like [Penaeus monodon]|uniref:basic salivary proline-rich protein 1-like n=1 Tax=Penaeus monodon TaxID=6687 RepID=UPI0018A7A32E|nr:basic salivary proline-rich protein 1-like [Penaeus monodon]